MAWSQTDLERIEAAIAKGYDLVTFSDGRTVRYRSMSDLLAARDVIKAAVDTAAGTSRDRCGYVSFYRD